MSKAEFCDIFTSAQHEWKCHRTLPYGWNKFNIQQKRHWIFCLLHFPL